MLHNISTTQACDYRTEWTNTAFYEGSIPLAPIDFLA